MGSPNALNAGHPAAELAGNPSGQPGLARCRHLGFEAMLGGGRTLVLH